MDMHVVVAREVFVHTALMQHDWMQPMIDTLPECVAWSPMSSVRGIWSDRWDTDTCEEDCRVVEVNRSSCARAPWAFERYGPFVSHGGYDFWKWSALRVFAIESGERVSAYHTSPTDAHGNLIGLPPLHTHHFHVAPSSANINVTVMMEQHGDWVTDNPRFSCTQRTYSVFDSLSPDFYVVDEPLRMIVTMNDVRPASSASLEWYLRTAVRLAQSDENIGARLSKHYILSPYDPRSPFLTLSAPHGRSLFAYQTYFALDTIVKHVNFHSHAGVERAFLLRGNVTLKSFGWRAKSATELGVSDLDGYTRGVLARTDVICTATPQTSALGYQRHARVHCPGLPLKMVSGTMLTSIALFEYKSEQHIHWFLTHATRDGRGHFTSSLVEHRQRFVVSPTPTRARPYLWLALLSAMSLFTLTKFRRDPSSYLM